MLNIQVKQLVSELRIPAFFIIGNGDTMVDLKKFKKMFDRYGTQNKILRVVKGEHNSDRPPRDMEEALSFIRRVYLRKNESKSRHQEAIPYPTPRKRILSDSRIKITESQYNNDLQPPTDRSRKGSFVGGSTNPTALMSGT